jgi:hypothetical protein
LAPDPSVRTYVEPMLQVIVRVSTSDDTESTLLKAALGLLGYAPTPPHARPLHHTSDRHAPDLWAQ